LDHSKGKWGFMVEKQARPVAGILLRGNFRGKGGGALANPIWQNSCCTQARGIR